MCNFGTSEYGRVIAELKANADLKYKEFNDRIINCDYPSIGVRVPIIRKLAKSVKKENRKATLDEFFSTNDKVFDIVLCMALIATEKNDYEWTRECLKKIVPKFGSWAHTDTVVPTLKWTEPRRLLTDFEYMLDGGTYEVRFYVICLLDYCLNDEYIDFALNTLTERVRFGDYYVDMATAWTVAEALVNNWDKAVCVLENRRLPPFIHNKSIQKARESFRISDDKKRYLQTLKV